jgi:hypothetical protein
MECEIYGMWNVWNLECTECGMYGMWNVRNVECTECEMYGMWNVRNVEYIRIHKLSFSLIAEK